MPAAVVPSVQRAVLNTWAHSRVLSHRRGLRARIVLLAAGGEATSRIAAQLGCPFRLFSCGGGGLPKPAWLEQDAPSRGRPRVYDQGTVAKIISVSLGRPPEGETNWTALRWCVKWE